MRIFPAPADLTALVLACTVLAFRTLGDMMGAPPEEFGELPSSDAAISITALSLRDQKIFKMNNRLETI